MTTLTDEEAENHIGDANEMVAMARVIALGIIRDLPSTEIAKLGYAASPAPSFLLALEEAERALGPFADWFLLHAGSVPDDHIVLQWVFGDRGHLEVTLADFRKAASALSLVRWALEGKPVSSGPS